MTRRTFVFIVCSPHGRVGVSTTARLLTDFHLLRRSPVEGFDTDPHEPDYGGWFPDHVRIVDAADIKGQISLFDRLLVNDETPKIVDIWARSYARFFAIVKDIGFFEEARRHGVEPIILFHADATHGALKAAFALNAAWPDLAMLVVHNEGAAPLGDNPHEILLRYPARGKFVIAPLEGPVARLLHDPSLSLSRFLLAPPSGMSIVLRAALRNWILRSFTQFRSFELRLELEASEYLR